MPNSKVTAKVATPKLTPDNYKEYVSANTGEDSKDSLDNVSPEVAVEKTQSINFVSMEQAIQGQREAMERYFKNSVRVKMVVPLGEGEPKGTREVVGINGYNFYILKGKLVEIPQEVAILISNKYDMDLDSGSKYAIDRDEKIQSALS